MMTFPLGRPIFVLGLIALLTGSAVRLRPAPPPHDLTVWVFDEALARTFRERGREGRLSLIEQYRQRTGKRVAVQLIAASALDTRLLSIFNSPRPDQHVPDLVALEIGSAGKFLRPPVEQVGLLPLDGFLRQSGWLHRIVASRFAPWSKRGVIFGVPLDVHPVTLTYRRDLFEQAGIDLISVQTWEQLHQQCLRLQEHFRNRGGPPLHALELFSARSDQLQILLLQRGVNLIDDQGAPQLTNPKVADTIAFYATVVAGPERVAADPIPGAARWVRSLAEGRIAAALTPDYRVDDLRRYAPELSGKLAMIPLPRFNPQDAPTSTWGGTMIGIPRHARSPEQSWHLLEFLCLGPEAAEAGRVHADVLPAVIDRWNAPDYKRPDPYFGGQPIAALYTQLAARIPPRYVGPYSLAASGELSAVLRKAVDHLEEHGEQDLRANLENWLAQSQARLQRLIDFAKFEP